MKRKFEGKELAFATKSLENKKQERDWLQYQLQYHELMLKTGLEMNYKKTIRDFKQNKNEFEHELAVVKNVISILTGQIRNGVEEKKPEEKKGDEEENKTEDKQ